MARQPTNIDVGVDDKLPWPPTLLLALQHVLAMTSTIVLGVLIVKLAGGSTQTSERLVQSTMLAMGIGSILMGLKGRFIGTGYLMPLLTAPAYFLAAIPAIKIGGLPLFYGMALFGAIAQIFIASIFHRLEKLFPIEITGIVVLMIGISLIKPAFINFTGTDNISDVTHVNETVVIIASITLAIMIGLTIWGRELARYGLIIAIVVGFILAYSFGILTQTDLSKLHQASFLSLPSFGGFQHMTFRLELVLPFFFAALTAVLKGVGNTTTCQKINDADWARPDMENIRKGIFTNGLSNIIAAFFGGMPNSVSSSNVGLSIATGVTSRYIGIAAGAFYIVFAFIPKIAAIFTIMPKPIIGATFFYVTAFMIIAGMQILLSRMIDARKTFIIGIALAAGLTVDFSPSFFTTLFPSISYIVGSALTVSILVAIILNLIFRIGISKRSQIMIREPKNISEKLMRFFEQSGSKWGATYDVIRRGATAAIECTEALYQLNSITSKKILVKLLFDEYTLQANLIYYGIPPNPEVSAPTKAQLLKDPNAKANLGFYLMRQNADSINVTQKKQQTNIEMRFKL